MVLGEEEELCGIWKGTTYRWTSQCVYQPNFRTLKCSFGAIRLSHSDRCSLHIHHLLPVVNKLVFISDAAATVTRLTQCPRAYVLCVYNGRSYGLGLLSSSAVCNGRDTDIFHAKCDRRVSCPSTDVPMPEMVSCLARATLIASLN